MKEYQYKIYDRSGVFVATLLDVADRHPRYQKSISSGCGATTITLARSRASFSICSDLIPGYEIKIIEKTGGKQVYSGYINRSQTGVSANGEETVSVECLGYVSELQQRVLEDADGDTGLNALSSDPSDMVSDILDLYAGKITAGTIETSGVVADCAWNASTILQAIDAVMERLPNDWIWYVDSENKLHLKHIDTSSHDHLLSAGKGGNVGKIDLSVSIDSVVNDVRVIGGTPDGGEQVYGRDHDVASQEYWGKRQKIVSDGRIYSAESLLYIEQSNMNQTPVGEAVVEVFDNEDNSNGYDIESIEPGDVIIVKDPASNGTTALYDEANFDESYFDCAPNDVLGLPLIVTNIEYFGDRAKITAVDRIAKTVKDLETVKRNFESFRLDRVPIGSNA